MSLKMKLIPLALAQIFAGGALSLIGAPAVAQETVVQEPIQRIEVTGSMIKRINAETAEAVTIVKVEALKDMGVTTLEQALSMVTSNNSTLTTASSVGSYSGGASVEIGRAHV